MIVDDDADDRLLFSRALEKSGLKVELFEATDGYAAINYLLGNEAYADRARFPFPDLVVLDLKMPGMDGFEVLKQIRASMGLQNLPVVVFTNSDSKNDVAAAYSGHASAFHQKPYDSDHLVRLLQRVIPLWLHPISGMSDRTTQIRPSLD